MTGESVNLIQVREGGRYGCTMEVMTEGRTWWIQVCVGSGYRCAFRVNMKPHSSSSKSPFSTFSAFSFVDSKNHCIFAPDSISPAGRRVMTLQIKTSSNVIFYLLISQIMQFTRRNATETSAWGVLYPFHIIHVWIVLQYTRRGLTRVAYPCERRCESLQVG